MPKRWDTPTDGISRKQFDRVNDGHIRRYVKVVRRVEILEKKLQNLITVWSQMEDPEEGD